jgi:histone-lysine N-methyltransferase SETMAR
VSAEGDERSWPPSTSKTAENAEKIRELIHEDRRRTSHELADTVGISYGICQETLTENFNMRRISAKFVPRLLTNDQKQRRINLCVELREKANENQTFICRIITGDEIWIYSYDPEIEQQSLQCKSPQ